MLLDRTIDVSTTPVAGANLPLETRMAIQDFLFHEARLLDESRYDEWMDLWAEDGRYWVPRKHDQENPFDHVSLFWEDALLREIRVRRLAHERNWSQQPPTRSSRLVGNVTVEGTDKAGHLIVRSSLRMTDWRLEQRHFAATVFHKLAATDDGSWKIVLKRVNLVNCDGQFGILEVYF